MHILEGLKIAVDNIDAVIDLIRSSKDTDAAKAGLHGDLRPVGAPGAGDPRHAPRQADRPRARGARSPRSRSWRCSSRASRRSWAATTVLMAVVIAELEALKAQYGDARRTEIVDVEGEIDIEDLIAHEEMVVTVTHGGYVKRNPKSLYKAQRRGGRGITGAATNEEDFVAQLFVASTHDTLLMFTNKGRAYTKKVCELPQAGRTARARRSSTSSRCKRASASSRCCRCASSPRARSWSWRRAPGMVKKTSLERVRQHPQPRASSRSSIDDGDDLVERAHHRGRLRRPARHAQRLGHPLPRGEGAPHGPHRARRARHPPARESDEVVGMAVIPRDAPATLLTVCEHGYGKRTPPSDYPTKNRGGKGVITIKTTERNGKVVGLRLVTDDDDLMLITDGGKLIRMPVDGIPTIGRNTQGVRLIRLETDEQVVAMERLAEKEEGETEVAPEVAAARAEAQSEPLAEEDLGEEAAGDDEDDAATTTTRPTTRATTTTAARRRRRRRRQRRKPGRPARCPN